jgi:hypothetical protein
MYVAAVCTRNASRPPQWGARCLREWSRTSIRTASGATANGQGRRAVLRRKSKIKKDIHRSYSIIYTYKNGACGPVFVSANG